MAITIKIKQLLDASRSSLDGKSSLQRLFSIPKTISAGHANRKLPAAIQEELKHFEEARIALAERHGGTRPNPSVPNYVVPEERRPEFDRDFALLLEQQLDLPGVPLQLQDLLAGGLLEEDYELLGPFLLGL